MVGEGVGDDYLSRWRERAGAHKKNDNTKYNIQPESGNNSKELLEEGT